jgi:hypothetical protein
MNNKEIKPNNEWVKPELIIEVIENTLTPPLLS